MQSDETWKNMRVLVVDDDRVVLHVIQNVLEDMGLVLTRAMDASSAIDLLRSEQFDLLVTDKNLPGTSGLEILREAKSIDANMGTLLVTAYASRESIQEAKAIGVDDYIEKPFDIVELIEKVQLSIKRRQTNLLAKQSSS